MSTTTSKTKLTGAVVGAAVALLGFAGCSSSAHAGTTAAGNTTPAQSSTASSPDSSPSSAASGAPDNAATAAQGLSDWVAAVVDGDYTKACRDMAAPAAGATSGPLHPAAAADCTPNSTPVAGEPSPVTELHDLHTSFTPADAAGPTVVHINGVAPTGSTVTVHANQIVIDGKTLTQIVVSHSTGVTAANLDISFEMAKIAGSWYVGDMTFDV